MIMIDYVKFCISDYKYTCDYVELSRLAYALGIRSEDYSARALWNKVYEILLKDYAVTIPPLKV